VAAPPERGRANEALVELLSSALEVPRSSFRVVSGEAGRTKLVEVDGLDPLQVERRLERKIRS
jgi:uncharacterized protein YggU (UPF0235/DUF167 family)